ncbi:hypothetical protein [Solimicrobium silvestre]|uniref:Uncharacterized protein n=1 Tax=Solimicrobium silvestre TaxID=2099400 RepID=A0A2S9GTG4_9BURK|nr:hypothetical protein [Solimicrobium silvestre]PRC90991.1 hypothetical protein S2091_4287 [Solimicrobium silvestre]
MPTQEITFSDDERDMLERVRLQQGLATLEQTAEWLVKSRLRNQTKHFTGRGRSLYAVTASSTRKSHESH